MNLIDSGKISGKQAKEVFAEMFASGKSAAVIVEEKGIEQLSDAAEIETLCDQVIAKNPKPVADFKAGPAASLEFSQGTGNQTFTGDRESCTSRGDFGAEIKVGTFLR